MWKKVEVAADDDWCLVVLENRKRKEVAVFNVKGQPGDIRTLLKGDREIYCDETDKPAEKYQRRAILKLAKRKGTVQKDGAKTENLGWDK